MLKKSAAVFVVLVLLYAVAGFFALPAYLHTALEDKLSLALHRTVSIDRIAVNPFMLSIRVTGLSIVEKGSAAPFVAFDELALNAQVRSLFKGGPIVREVTLTNPRVAVTRLGDGTYNFSDLLKKKQAPVGQKPKKPLRFSVGNIVVRNGSVLFTDNAARTSHKATDINLSIPFVSNMDEFVDVYVQPKFSARINGTLFTLAGTTKPFHDSLETSLGLDLAGVSLPFYMGYLPPGLRLGLTSGTLDVKSRLSYVQYKGRKPSLTLSGDLALHRLALEDKGGKPLLSLAEARVSLAPSTLTDRLVHVGTIDLKGPVVFVERDRDGRLNLASIRGKDEKKPEKKDKAAPFVVKLDGITLTGGSVRFTDASKETPVKLSMDSMSFHSKGLSTQTGVKGSFDLSSNVNGRSTVTASATLSLKPLLCDAKLDISDFEPAWVQPYFTDRIRIMVTKGSFSTSGALHVEKDKGGKPSVTYDGRASVIDFASLDKATSEEFLRCRAFSLDTLSLSVNPGSLSIGRVMVMDLSSRIVKSKNGVLNVASIVKKDEARKAPEAAGASPAGGKKAAFEKIAIREVVVEGARVLFVDKSVKDGYAAELSRLKGTVRGISSSRLARADVKLTGVLNRSAPVLVTGRINPFRENLFVNLHTSLTDLDLSPMTPYSGTFLGCEVEKGKLSLDLTYNINHKDLAARNSIFVDQLTFGKGVDSPKATKLPVRFAISLLKDAQGRIDLKVPVEGRTDDPKFSVWGIVLTVLKNLVVKAATSPFLLLDAMYPGASSASTVEFAHGRADLPEGSDERFATLGKILEDKPGLNLEIRGYADPETDAKGLADYLFERKLKAQKLKAMLARGQQGVSLRDIAILPEEYPVYLKKAYADEEFPKPRNFIGLPVDLPPAEMEKLIRQHIEVTASDLRLLAVHRAQKVQERLAAAQKVAPSRIFLIETGGDAPAAKQGVKSSRVELTLK